VDEGALSLSLSGQARSDLFIPSGERPEAIPTRRAGAVDLCHAPGTDRAEHLDMRSQQMEIPIGRLRSDRQLGALLSGALHTAGQFRPRPSRQAARPYVYASPTPGVNARFCRDDDVPLVATERTEVDDLHSPQQDHRANVRASILGVPRALPVRDIPARSLAVSMAGQSQGHGNGSRQVADSRSCRWRGRGPP